jgi:regulator of PEP synthase PpsR (kinase-PPPase family)
MLPKQRSVFFISDRTGVTVEMLGHSLLAQFPAVPIKTLTLPFIDTAEKARQVVERIHIAALEDGARPIVFSTLVTPDVRAVMATCNALVLDLFDAFMASLEAELGVEPSHRIGAFHGMHDVLGYQHRIEAVNYTLNHDDGITVKNFEDADVILVGVSRCGKTPTCLYLAIQYGIQAGNFPLTPDDFEKHRLPQSIRPFRHKLYGLTITAERLSQIRGERRPDSRYASIENCRHEVRQAEQLLRQERVPFLETTHKSIEEIASTIMVEAKLDRRLY